MPTTQQPIILPATQARLGGAVMTPAGVMEQIESIKIINKGAVIEALVWAFWTPEPFTVTVDMDR